MIWDSEFTFHFTFDPMPSLPGVVKCSGERPERIVECLVGGLVVIIQNRKLAFKTTERYEP